MMRSRFVLGIRVKESEIKGVWNWITGSFSWEWHGGMQRKLYRANGQNVLDLFVNQRSLTQAVSFSIGYRHGFNRAAQVGGC